MTKSSQTSFLALSVGKRKRADAFLDTMDKVVPWAGICAVIAPHHAEAATGRPKTDLELLVRCLCLAQWFNLSDEALEDAIHDRASFRRFLRLDGFDAVPDHIVYCRFRKLIGEKGLATEIFDRVNAMLVERGLMMREGTLMDATIITAPSSTKNADKKRDPDMTSTKKGNQWFFGMKAHIGVDADSGLVHTLTFTTAKTHDSVETDNLLHGDEIFISGDKAYGSAELKKFCEDNDIDYAVIEKRRPGTTDAEDAPRKTLNRLKSAFRCAVEFPFRIVKRLWGHDHTRYRGIAKNASWLTMSFTLANLYLSRRDLLKRPLLAVA